MCFFYQHTDCLTDSLSTLRHLATAVVLRKTTKGTQCVISRLLLCTHIFLKKKKTLTHYTMMYVKNLVNQTLENLRNSAGKLPQKGVRRRRKNRHMSGTVQYRTLPESPLLGCIPQQTSVPVAYGINRSCQHFGHL